MPIWLGRRDRARIYWRRTFGIANSRSKYSGGRLYDEPGKTGLVSKLTLRRQDTPFPVPTIASGAGYNTEIFFDHFTTLSTIDVTGTYDPSAGHKWYVHRDFPLAPETDWHSIKVIPANSFSISNSVLTLANISGNNWCAAIETATTNLANNALIGKVFRNGYYTEVQN